ncbi:MAG: topoisomerase C-terminal repeat-containing protein [Nocardioidaceae bacterium]
MLANPAGAEIELGQHPGTGLPVIARSGRYGPYVTEVLARGRAQVGEAAHVEPVQDDGAGNYRPGTGTAAAHLATRCRHRPRVG